MLKKSALNTHKFILLLLVVFLSACASEYVPSEKSKSIKQNMSTEQAVDILQHAIWEAVEPQGICGSRGFWYDNSANFEVTEKSINLLAHRRGKVLQTHQQKLGEIVVFEKAYYKYEFKFSDVIKINVVNDPRDVPTFLQCNKKDIEQGYKIIDLFVSKKTNLKFLVFNDEFDRLMASIELLFPGVKIYIK